MKVQKIREIARSHGLAPGTQDRSSSSDGSTESHRQMQEVAAAFRQTHELDPARVLWRYLRNPAYKKEAWVTTPADVRHSSARCKDGVPLSHEIQDMYLEKGVTIA